MKRLVRVASVIAIAIAGVLPALTVAVSAAGNSDPNYQPLPVKVRHELTSVPTGVLNRIGNGNRPHHHNSPPAVDITPALSHHGKPEMVYILGEFCPYCAAESWSVVVALSRFGEFHGLTTLSSSPTDVDPNTPTISFRHSKYHSRYLVFDAIVNQDTKHHQVESVPRKIKKVWTEQPAAYPWVDFGGKAILDAPSFDPKILAHLTRAQIAGDLAHTKRPVALSIDGGANQVTAAICVMTKDQPAKICTSRRIARIERQLPHSRSFH